jgi:dTDP-4-amino-4,6-dideoxygalactose transaminase
MQINIAKPVITEAEVQNVIRVLQSGQLAAGRYVRELEGEFAQLAGARFAVATSSGTTALQAAVRALGLRAGDKVITTPLSFVATANVLLEISAVPVFVDIDPLTYNLSAAAVEQALCKHPDVKAILGVHLYGLPFDPRLAELAEEHQVFLIEDAAQAHGATVHGRPVGSLGHIAAFSFYPTKNMTTSEGGIVTTSDPALAERVRLIVNQGQRARYSYVCLGFNYRMTELQAAIGLPQLQQLAVRNRRRQAIAEYYRSHLPTGLRLPATPPGYTHVFHQYTLSSRHRARLMAALADAGISSVIYYPQLISQERYLADYPYLSEACPAAEAAVAEIFSIPVHPALSDDDVAWVAKTIQREWELIEHGS